MACENENQNVQAIVSYPIGYIVVSLIACDPTTCWLGFVELPSLPPDGGASKGMSMIQVAVFRSVGNFS